MHLDLCEYRLSQALAFHLPLAISGYSHHQWIHLSKSASGTHNRALMLYSSPLDISICYHLLCAYTRYQIRNDVLSPLPCPHTKTSGSR